MKMKKSIFILVSVAAALTQAHASTDYNLIAKATELLIDKSSQNEQNILSVKSSLGEYEKSLKSSQEEMKKSNSEVQARQKSFEQKINKTNRTSQAKVEGELSALQADYKDLLERLNILETKIATKEQNSLEDLSARLSKQSKRLKHFVESATPKGSTTTPNVSE